MGWLCCGSMITGTEQVASTAVDVGDQIPMQVYVENSTGRQVGIKFVLIEREHYYVQGRCHTSGTAIHILEHRCEPVQPHSASSTSFSLCVPRIRLAITHSRIIKTEHIVQVVFVIP